MRGVLSMSPRFSSRGVLLVVLALAVCLQSSALALARGDANRAGCSAATEESSGFRSYLPDCRAYELVSPVYKEGHPVYGRYISEDGSHVIGESLGAFAGTEDVPKGYQLSAAIYELSRTESGWVTSPLTPPASQFADDFSGNGQLVSSDLGTTIWVLTKPSQSVFQRDLYLRMPNGSLALVGPMTPTTSTNHSEIYPAGGSGDLSHIMFTLEGGRGIWPGDTTSERQPSLYESIVGAGNPEPKLVGVKNNGPLASNTEAQLISRCGTVLGRGGEEPSRAISASGETAFFTAQACEGSPPVNELYARIGGSRTIAISEPSPAQCSSLMCTKAEESERGEATFQSASDDGSKVLFTTAQPLLDGDADTTTDLYEAEITSSGIQKLIQVSRGDSSDATQGAGARVLGVSAVSRDLSRVYFVAEGVLATAKNSQGQQGAAGAPNLYLVEPASGHTTFITTLLPSDHEDWAPGTSSVRSTPDGRFLVFDSAGQIFEYDSQTGTLVSVASNGQLGYVSSDGSYVFFTSQTALTPQATTGISSVYEYHGGQVFLISDGRDVQGEGVRLLGIDSSGENVFFETLSPLVSQDTDTQVDIYDARVGGGFPGLVSPAGCSGDRCQGPSSAAPSLPVAGSVSQAGGGNVVPLTSRRSAKPIRHKKKKKGTEHRRRKRGRKATAKRKDNRR